jgi:hypothetical protein
MLKTVNIMRARELERDADRVLREILNGFADVHVESQARSRADFGHDLTVDALSQKARFRFAVQVKSRVTPQTALFACDQFRELPKGMIPVIFAPTISPRVAEILRDRGIGYADSAGNCWLRSLHDHLLIERQGYRSERQSTPAAADPFSTKSSRIVRALLSRPRQGWQVRKLAEDPDVQVSAGLVVKVKRALVEEGYAVERDRLLYLREPIGLLNAWSQKYAGPTAEIPLYFRGDAAAAEQTISQWCRANSLQYALAGFSAAWRLAPEVRYSVASVYVGDRGFDQKLLDQLAVEYGGKRVDSGPNLILWRPFDSSTFAGVVHAGEPEQPITSVLQTWLDLKHERGRGEDAASALFEKYLGRELQAAVKHETERQHGGV